MSVRSDAWTLFDAEIAQAATDATNPWVRRGRDVVFEPDLRLLSRLLGIPLVLDAASQTGVPALALDVWTSHEFRRAGFDPDRVWPRATAPRVLPREVSMMTEGVRGPAGDKIRERLALGTLSGVSSASAKVLGKNYVKQVDVLMSGWDTGPELMVSTKRMDSSFGKNAANRVEESYGDAKNLRLRHPRSALGFMYSLRSTALVQEPDKAEWLIDLLMKLGREDDAYDAVALVIPDWGEAETEGLDDELAPAEDAIVAAGLDASSDGDVPADHDAGSYGLDASPASLSQNPPVGQTGPSLPEVTLRLDAVPSEVSPGRFFGVMVRRVLDNSPVDFHREARRRLAAPRESET